MSHYTQAFINLYQHDPAAALNHIDRYAMQYQQFDSKRAAEACGLIWDGGYEIDTSGLHLDQYGSID